MTENELNPPEIVDDNNIVEVEDIDDVPEIMMNELDDTGRDMEQLCNDQETVRGLIEITETTLNKEEGLDETSLTLIETTIESMYRRHGVSRSHRVKFPSMEGYNKCDYIREVKVSLEGILGDIGKGIKKAWEAICDFFKSIWRAIFGGASSTSKSVSDLDNKIKDIKKASNLGDKTPIKVTKKKYAEIIRHGNLPFSMQLEALKNREKIGEYVDEALKRAAKDIGKSENICNAILNMINVIMSSFKNGEGKEAKDILSAAASSDEMKKAINEFMNVCADEFKKVGISEKDIEDLLADRKVDNSVMEKVQKVLDIKNGNDPKDIVMEKMEKNIADIIENMSDEEFEAMFNLRDVEITVLSLYGFTQDMKKYEAKTRNYEKQLGDISNNPIPSRNATTLVKDALKGYTQNVNGGIKTTKKLTNELDSVIEDSFNLLVNTNKGEMSLDQALEDKSVTIVLV